MVTMSSANSLPERNQLARLVEQWNENRLDLFHLSYPTEELEIQGVMRFYFQDGGDRVLTKCVRVSSTATTRDVVEGLSNKFLPDLKMLTDDVYSLWEVHENGAERRLDEEEKPLLVQLNWHRDDREGRFLLRKDRNTTIPLSAIQLQEDGQINKGQRYSKREKKEKKKQQKEIVTVNGGREEPLLSTDIYRQVPQNTFTRTISNPEVVMKRKREKKLEARLKDMGHGGSLKIYGGELVPARPYVSILVSVRDRADKILSEAVEKYGFDNAYGEFILVELPVAGHRRSMSDVHAPPSEGRIIGPDEFPLQQMAMTENGPETYLALRKTPSDYRVPSSLIHETGPSMSTVQNSHSQAFQPAFLVVGTDGIPSNPPQWVSIRAGVTEVGSDRALEQYAQQAQNIYINEPDVCGRHCVITFMENVVTITPSASDARIEVNGRRIGQTEILQNGDIVIIGRSTVFRFSANKDVPLDMSPHSDYSQMNHAMYAASISGGSSGGSRQPSDQMEARGGGSAPTGHLQLPVSLQIGEYKVWDYLVEVMSRGWSDSGSFRLSPAYALYLALRFFHAHSKPYLVQFFTRIGHHMNQISQECTSRDELLFWLANASELSYLVERNPDLRTPRSGQLGSVVEGVFRRLCTVLLGAIRPACHPLMDTRLGTEESIAELISLLDSTLRAARASRLNPALTIQLSSQMFHTINAAIFNGLVGVGSMQSHLNTRLGRCLLQRLGHLHGWAEQMGVELAAECHLDRCRQAGTLLAAQKNDVASLGATCYKLNSIQVRYLLSNFHVENGEIPCDSDVISRVVGLAERQADQLTRQDGLPLTLEETDQLSLPFLLPQDGYTAEQLRSVPDGLAQYLFSLQDKGFCHSVSLTEQHSNHTDQNLQGDKSRVAAPTRVPMQRSASQSTLTSIPTQFGDSFGSSGDDIIRVTLKRGGGGIGLSIVAAQGIGDRQTGIYVKKVVDGTPAAIDGRLSAGDQLLSVNGHSLIGITQEDAAQYMGRSGAEVHFEVRKGAANRNGLATWLCGNGNTPVGVGPFPIPQQPQQYVPPSPSMSQSMHSQLSGRNSQVPAAPPSYSNYAPISKFGSQMSVQPTATYQQRNQQVNSRTSAFAPPVQAANEPPRHVRSISASDLYQNDPNASFSQRSIASTTTGGGFDKLPAHYRQSTRPTVVQPGRPCPSPSALRRGAQSPSSIYRPPSVNGLYRPPSVTNLFAPPKSPNPLQGYSSSGLRESNPDLYRASGPSSPPQAHSSPLGDYYPSNYSASLPAPIRPSTYSNQSHNGSAGFSQSQYAPIPSRGAAVPRATVGPNNGYSQRYQEPVVVRPSDLGMVRDYTDHGEHREDRREERQVPTVRGGAVPTAITQALSLQAAHAGGVPSKVARPVARPPAINIADREVRELERNTAIVMSRDSVNDELDRLDSRGINMTEEETRRYRELLSIAADQNRSDRRQVEPAVAPAPITAARRTETLIDDIQSTSSISARENITPPEARRGEKKTVQFRDDSSPMSPDSKDDIDSPSILGNNEVYRDPRQRRLNELQERQVMGGPDGSNLDFRDKMKLFAHQIGESTPKQRFSASSAERHIQRE